MAQGFLISVDLADLDSQGLDIKTVSYLNRAFTTVNSNTVAAALALLQREFKSGFLCIDVTAVDSLADILNLLDHGAAKVFVTFKQWTQLVEGKLFEDLGRLVLSLDRSPDEEDVVESLAKVKQDLTGIGNVNIGVHFNNIASLKPADNVPVFPDQKEPFPRYISMKNQTWEGYEQAFKHGYIPIIPACSLTTSSKASPNLVPVELLVITAITTDRLDELYPTVVVNEHGQCLGLVYSNAASIKASLQYGKGVYKSRKRQGLWIKGETSGDTQELVSITWDCDGDALRFTVRQRGGGFCHLKTSTCFGSYNGLSKLETTLRTRKSSAPSGSYTARLFSDPKLLEAKIMEEASELCGAQSKDDIAAEAADLIYFAMTRCIAAGVSLEDVERNLDLKSLKTSRRKGDAKPQWANAVGLETDTHRSSELQRTQKEDQVKEAASTPKSNTDMAGIKDNQIKMRRYKTSETEPATLKEVLQRPSQKSTEEIMKIVKPIIERVRTGGDAAVLEYTHKFEKATSLTTPVLRAPFPADLMQLPQETIDAIDISYENIRRFHAAQKEDRPLQVETMPGVVCSRFAKPIERVGLYVPGGTAVLPSSAMMLGVPAMVAGCKKIVLASPPRSDGSLTPEVIYIAHKIGAESIVLAGGAQAIAAMAYGTESISKVDKILGPGNQFVTAAKMHVSNDTTACVSIDMPAGPSEVLVIADKTANPAFVASDLLSQAEHGTDSQVVLIAVDLDEQQLKAIEDQLNTQANALPRVDIVRGAIEHSVTLVVTDIQEAMVFSNAYAPEHLILQVQDAEGVVSMVENAGSIFIGQWTPESVGDYSAGVNHSLPTYGYAKQYSGVNLASFTKHITSSHLTQEGLKNVGPAVMQLAKVEQLEAHRRAVSIRLDYMAKMEK